MQYFKEQAHDNPRDRHWRRAPSVCPDPCLGGRPIRGQPRHPIGEERRLDAGHGAPAAAVADGRRRGRAGPAQQALPPRHRLLCTGRARRQSGRSAHLVPARPVAPVRQPGRHDLPAGTQRLRRGLPGPQRRPLPDPLLQRRHRGTHRPRRGPGRHGHPRLPAGGGARGGDPLQPLAGARVRRLRRGVPAHRDRAGAQIGLCGAQHRPARRHGRRRGADPGPGGPRGGP